MQIKEVILTETAGVGRVASPALARDPRYSTSLTVDVRPDTLEKELKAYRLKEDDNSAFKDALRTFIPFVMKELDLKELPEINFTKSPDSNSFGKFEEGVITVDIAGRHPNDILRTLAHELVHYKQWLANKLDDESGITGSEEENEANAGAGIVMRNFNQENPELLEP